MWSGRPFGIRANLRQPLREKLNIRVLKELLAVVKLPPEQHLSAYLPETGFVCLTRTQDELSLVCEEKQMRGEFVSETGWRALKVAGVLDFSAVGVLAAIAQPLAHARVSIFSISTFDTDYVLVKADKLQTAIAALRDAGHTVAE